MTVTDRLRAAIDSGDADKIRDAMSDLNEPSESPRLEAGAGARAEAEATACTDGAVAVDLRSEGSSAREGFQDVEVAASATRNTYAPEMRMLLADWHAHLIEPLPVPHGDVPSGMFPEDYAILHDLIVRQGLQALVHDPKPVPYATSEAVHAKHVRYDMQASRALHRLEDAGLIECVGTMPRHGRKDKALYPNGTRLFRVLPPGGHGGD